MDLGKPKATEPCPEKFPGRGGTPAPGGPPPDAAGGGGAFHVYGEAKAPEPRLRKPLKKPWRRLKPAPAKDFSWFWSGAGFPAGPRRRKTRRAPAPSGGEGGGAGLIPRGRCRRRGRGRGGRRFGGRGGRARPRSRRSRKRHLTREQGRRQGLPGIQGPAPRLHGPAVTPSGRGNSRSLPRRHRPGRGSHSSPLPFCPHSFARLLLISGRGADVDGAFFIYGALDVPGSRGPGQQPQPHGQRRRRQRLPPIRMPVSLGQSHNAMSFSGKMGPLMVFLMNFRGRCKSITSS
jgi:hypothetical protein